MAKFTDYHVVKQVKVRVKVRVRFMVRVRVRVRVRVGVRVRVRVRVRLTLFGPLFISYFRCVFYLIISIGSLFSHVLSYFCYVLYFRIVTTLPMPYA